MGRQSFQDDLDDLRDSVLSMGEAVLGRHRDAVAAIGQDDPGRAQYVLDNDDEINDLYLDLEAACIDLFALEQPVASDLRFVAASFKILTDLERVGDLATNLAEYAVSMESDLLPRAELVEIGDLVAEMIDDALTAYARRDGALCEELASRDDEVDARCEAAADDLMRELLTRTPTAPATEDFLQDTNRVLLTIRDLERVGDHAVNVAARTYYVVEGDDDLLY